MKLVQISFPFEFTEEIERILAHSEITDYLRVGMIAGHDSTGKHTGSQVHPGNLTLISAQVGDDELDGLLDDLEEFRAARRTHRSLSAVVVPVERRIGEESANQSDEPS
ncbi:MAG: PG0541 family transporter-associated protein [Phycisphaerae bacterium]